MAITRRQQAKGFWDNHTTTGTNEKSAIVKLGHSYQNLCLLVTAGADCTITVEVGADEFDSDSNPTTFFPLFYLDTEMKMVLGAGTSRAMLIPDFSPYYVRLSCNASGVLLTAGYVITGD